MPFPTIYKRTCDWAFVASGCWLILCGASGPLLAQDSTLGSEPDPTKEFVGRYSQRMVTPVNQVLTPFGRLVDLPGLRPQGLALSPDGAFLAVSGKTSELLTIDPDKGEVSQRVPLPADPPENHEPVADNDKILTPDTPDIDTRGQLSYTGLIFSADGSRIYMSNVNGSIKVFSVDENHKVSPAYAIALPPAMAPRRAAEIPSGLAVSQDGKRLYVVGNLSNTLFEIDLESRKVNRRWDVGAAPYDVALVGRWAFVSNWGGRRPSEGDLTGPAGRGTTVRVDPIHFVASEGSVTRIDLKGDEPPVELVTGLHASGLAVSPDHRYVVCANAGSDHLSVISVDNAEIVETIWTKPNAADLLGASPNAIAFHPSGKRLFVANGSQNSIALVEFEPAEKESRLEGFVPVGWYPGAVVFDAKRNLVCAANIKGLPLLTSKQPEGGEGFNSHQYTGGVSMFAPVEGEELAALSEQVAKNMRSAAIKQAALPPRSNQPAKAVPERIGEPSTIKHVVYVIKENRTFDQVFGAIGRGRARADLCIFGERVTPNSHRLVNEFVLLDNAYCAGICSADGHQWSTTAFSTDYMEKSFAGFPRSYPDGMGVDEDDALAYSPAGFIWDNARLHGKTVRNYGEFMAPKVRFADRAAQGSPKFMDCFLAWKNKTNNVLFECYPMVESIKDISPTQYVGWEMNVPDQYRADFVINELHDFEAKGEFPNLVIICLPNDHTSGADPQSPTPAACVADNDLAFGRIVEALSHSKFWPEMAILAIEDDPQAGWDHVSGYRTTVFCISPYARRGELVSTQYNTTSLIRTIEQILGLPPMNQFDASATPMFDCFQDTPNLSPFVAAPANVSLDELNPNIQAIHHPVLREDALVSASLNFREVDKAPEDVLNQILWRAMRGPDEPYPSWAVTFHGDEEEEAEERLHRFFDGRVNEPVR